MYRIKTIHIFNLGPNVVSIRPLGCDIKGLHLETN